MLQRKKWKRNLFRLAAFVFTLGVLFAAGRIQCGILTVMSPAQEEVRLPVIMYHNLSEKSNQLGEFMISPSQLEEDLRYLKEQGYHTVTTKQIIDYANGNGNLPKKPILLTFDDGYEGDYVYAYPLLKKYGMTALLSVVGERSDRFTRIEDHHISYSHCTWEQIDEMYRDGVFEIGNHTYDLHSLEDGRRGCKRKPGEPVEKYQNMLREDLQKNLDCIRQATGLDSKIFTYPYGFISKESYPVIEELGFQITFAANEKVNYISRDPTTLYLLGRYNRSSGKSVQNILENMK